MKSSRAYFIKALLYLLFPVSLLYLAALKSKELLFAVSLLKKRQLPAKVISVGNITLGGTGKTPHVLYLAGVLKDKNLAVITRGYARKNARKIIFSKEEMSPEVLGDEPFLLASELSGVPVVVSKDRFAAGLAAVEKYSAKTLILDDGFQRRVALARDLDIVLVDSMNPFGNGRLFPSGILREPKSALSAAEVIILTKCDAAETTELEAEVRRLNPGALIVKSRYAPDLPVNIRDNSQKLRLEEISGKRVAALSGVGSPEYFEKILAGFGPKQLVPVRFLDHHYYSSADISKIDRLASSCDLIITTEKDAVKLVNKLLPETKLPAYVLPVRVKIVSGEAELLARLNG